MSARINIFTCWRKLENEDAKMSTLLGYYLPMLNLFFTALINVYSYFIQFHIIVQKNIIIRQKQ